MYEIYANDQLIHSDITPLETVKVLQPKLIMEDCAAGSLEFTIPPGNIGYNSIQKLTTDVIVKEDDEEIWRGRCISSTTDLWRNKKYMIEGALAFLNDSSQPPHEYLVANTTVRTFLESLIAEHNSQVKDNRKFKVGTVTVEDGDSQQDDDSIHRYTNYESTLECINEKLVKKLGGHIRVKRVFDQSLNAFIFQIDYLKDYIDAHDKEIIFGVNLLDYASSFDVTDLVTAIVPRGARLDNSDISKLEAYTTVESCGNDGDWHREGSRFVTSKEAIDTYGFITGVVDWDDVTDPSNLLSKAKKYLQSEQFNKLYLEVSVVDLHYLNPDIRSFKLLEEVRCISDPHGMDTFFPVTKMEIDLADPGNTKFTLGTETTVSLTSATNKISSDILSYMNNTPGESAILKSAKDNARAIIEGTADGGYASFMYGTDQYGVPIIDPVTGEKTHPDRPTGFWVGNALTDANATNRWIWTYGGLMHQSKNTSVTPPVWRSPNVAMTMDGHFVADRITTGRLVLAGKRDGNNNYDPTTTKGFLEVYNGSTKIGNWDSSGIWINKGSIQLGTYSSAGYGNYKTASGALVSAKYPAIINDDGSAFFRYATLTQGCKVGAATIDAYGVLGNFGTASNMAGMRIGDGTFGISSDKASGNSGSWGGICFGAEAYDKRGWGNMSCILFDGAETHDGYEQGGFFVVHGSPNERGSNYTKQTYNTFTIVREGSGAATFDEEFFNRVKYMWENDLGHTW